MDSAAMLPGTERARRGRRAAASVQCEEEARVRVERHVAAAAAVAPAALREEERVCRRLA